MGKVSPDFKAKIKQLKPLLPRGFASDVVERLKKAGIDISESAVYAVSSGQSYNEHVVDTMIEIAKEGLTLKMKAQINEIDSLLMKAESLS